MANRDASRSRLADLFRERGFAATSLPAITEVTGLGKGSLYNLWPGGKHQMVAEVMDDIQAWFEREIFTQLEGPSPDLSAMIMAVGEFFAAGQRMCLPARIGLEPDLPDLAEAINLYFVRWRDAVRAALVTRGALPAAAAAEAEDAVVAMQGALVVGRAMADPAVFTRTLDRIEARLLAVSAPG